MTPRLMFFVLSGLLALTAIIGLGGFYLADKQLAARASTIADLKAEDDSLDQFIINANQAKDKLAELQSLKEITEQVLPAKKIQSNIVGEVITLAGISGVSLDAINFSNSAVSGNINFDVSQTQPLKGVKGVNVLEFSVVSNRTTYDRLIALLDNLEANRRKMQVVSVRVNPEIAPTGKPTGAITTELTINVYVRTE